MCGIAHLEGHGITDGTTRWFHTVHGCFSIIASVQEVLHISCIVRLPTLCSILTCSDNQSCQAKSSIEAAHMLHVTHSSSTYVFFLYEHNRTVHGSFIHDDINIPWTDPNVDPNVLLPSHTMAMICMVYLMAS
jgi:hypothetical protein